MTTNPTYIFSAKTREAFVIKILGELFSNTLKYVPFKFKENGIFIQQTDNKKEILLDISLNKEQFDSYKCIRPVSFEVNSIHLYKMLKSIKKKDRITLFITEEDPLRLGICVEQSDENNKVTTYIHITYTQPEVIGRPEGYENPIIMSNKEFVKMKNLHNISKNLTISSKPGFIKFFCDGGDIYSREIVIGNEDDEENKYISILYKQNFTTSHITTLTKCAAQSGNIQVYINNELPIKIKMKAGNLGDILVFIKSKELIQDEQYEEDMGLKDEDNTILSNQSEEDDE